MKAGSNVRFVSVFFTPEGERIEKGTIATTTYVDQIGAIVNINGKGIWANHDCVVEVKEETWEEKVTKLNERVEEMTSKIEELETALDQMSESVEQIKFDDNEMLDHVREFLKKVTQ